MNLKIRSWLALGVATLVPWPAYAAALGDPAAPLKVARWVKGDPLDLAGVRGEKIVVVDFWATWSAPCLESIPHLTTLQQRFADRGVLIVGVSDERVAVVESWVRKMGDRMAYRVAVDDNQATTRAYREAYGRTGIPVAFVVDKEGRVAWIGHPQEGLAETLEAILAGTYDIARTQRQAEARRLLAEFFEKARSSDVAETELAELQTRIEAMDRELGGLFPAQSVPVSEMLKQARTGRLVQRFEQAVMSNASQEELDRLEREIRPQLPPGIDWTGVRNRALGMRHMQDYLLAAYAGDKQQADTLAERTLTALQGQANALEQLAWFLLTEEGVQYRDRTFALRVAKAAFDASHGRVESIVDTYARALFDNGRVTEAIEQQKRAVALATDDNVRRQLERTLKEYEAKARP